MFPNLAQGLEPRSASRKRDAGLKKFSEVYQFWLVGKSRNFPPGSLRKPVSTGASPYPLAFGFPGTILSDYIDGGQADSRPPFGKAGRAHLL
jgi:hypothetical protein